MPGKIYRKGRLSLDAREKIIDYSLPGKNIKLKVVEDVEALITDPNDPDKVPCWAELWPAARAMALHIWERMDLAGKDVLELGCGLGLPGLTAGLKGAKITFSDFNQDALEMALETAKLNNIQEVEVYSGDWRNYNLNKKFDLILGSDICYDPKLNKYLVNIFIENLKEDGTLLLSHPERPYTLELLQDLKEFSSWMEQKFYKTVTVENSLFPYYTITINQLTKVLS